MSETVPFTSVNKEFNQIQDELIQDFKLVYSEYEKANQKFTKASTLLEESKKEYQNLNLEYE